MLTDRAIGKFAALSFSDDEINGVVSEQVGMGGICEYCGSEYDALYHNILSDTLKCRAIFHTDQFCRLCAFSLMGKQFRTRTMLFAGDIRKDLKRSDIWTLLFSDVEPPYILTIPENYKHNLFFGEISYDRNILAVIWNQKHIRFSQNEYPLYLAIQDMFRKFKQSKAVILNGEYNVSKLKPAEYQALKHAESVISPYRGTMVMQLFVEFVNKGEKSDG